MKAETAIDGYKFDHRRQYPTCTEFVYSNWTPRMSRIEGQNEVVFFGLQFFLKKYMMAEWDKFFASNVDEVCDRYTKRVNGYLGPNQIGSDHIRALHNLGYLPLKFSAVKEGSKVPLRCPMLTVENTHKDFAWLVNYFETIMSCVLWMPCTSATTASKMRKLLNEKAKLTGSPNGFVGWQGHDFSFRGMASPEAAALSGAGHLLYFTGTDTVPAIDLIEDYYAPPSDYFIGGSVAATEHSVMCAGGEMSEQQTFERLLDLYPSGIVSIVSDTWDLWAVLTKILPALKTRIVARDGKVVIRPDSGDPVKIICGDPEAAVNSPAYKGVVECLWDVFGGTETATGHRLLDSHIGCIYGDSITFERAEAICAGLAKKGFASGNMVLGIGSYCVSPETPILCSDLVWRAAGKLLSGQEIIAFDENPEFGDGKKAARRYRLAKIKSNTVVKKTCSRVTSDIGDPIVASNDHPWLVFAKNRKAGNVFYGGLPESIKQRAVTRTAGLEWKTTENLKPGDEIAFFSKPWKKSESREDGWLEGIFDGEGCLARSTPDNVRIPAWKVNISQNRGPVLDRIRTELENRGFALYEVQRNCPHLVILGGWVETLRFLGTVAPNRLVKKYTEKMLPDMPALSRDRTYKTAIVQSVESVGICDVASIETSCGTFITGGYLSHNTYQYVTRDTFGFAMKATWVQIDGKGYDIFKKPVTDNGMKNSAKGRLAVLKNAEGKLELISQATPEQEAQSVLQPVWVDGKFIYEEGFDVIRTRALGDL